METLRQSQRNNYPAASCVMCRRPMRYANPQLCDTCYGELSKANQLRKDAPCQPK